MPEGGESGFLPPQAPGPEPDLGDRGQDPTQPLPPTAQTQPLPPTGQPQGYPPPQQHPYAQPPQQPYAQPPPWQTPYGYGPPPGYGQAPPPGYGPPQGYAPPPQGWHQPQWAPAPPEPDNTPAVAGFAMSVTGGGFLLVSAGFSSLLSLGLSIAGLIYSRKGRARVDEGKTRKQRDLAQAGYVIGIISTILSLLATLFWLLFLILAITDESFQRQLENNNSGTIAIGLVKGIVGLLT
jgi:hypothetical protein